MIDVVIPVYKGLGHTRDCIESVLANHQPVALEVVVVDDASPEPDIVAYVDALARDDRVTLLRNETNQGFVRSVNRGMALHPDRDVVLLNSDSRVANDWLGRLSASACRADDIATATPLSNNATICSYPYEGWDGGLPGDLGLAGLDRVCAEANAGASVDIPTAVGFCMFIRRKALDELGLFDAERFGRGYGEENDFCMRALRAGWRHVLAADVFVFHEGAVSFSEDRFELQKAASAALLEAHPDYTRRVHEFIIADPAAGLRFEIDLARCRRGPGEAAHVLRERAAERRRLLSGLWQLEQLTEQRDSRIGELDHALQHASRLVTERDRAIAEQAQALAERDAQIKQLRGGLAHAENLAFSRQDELKRIYRSRLWRGLSYLARLRARSKAS